MPKVPQQRKRRITNKSKKVKKTPSRKRKRTLADRQWAAAVLKRDKYQCQHCGVTSRLQAHHILPYAKHRGKRLDLSNGITLCAACHSKQHPELPTHLFYRAYRYAPKKTNVKPKVKNRTTTRKATNSKVNQTRSKRKKNEGL